MNLNPQIIPGFREIDACPAASRPAPKVSVIMATFNRERLLPRSLEAVLGQTFEDFELIVCDDASADGTIEWLRAAKKSDSRIRILESDRNRGPGAVRNAGFTIARGGFLAVVDDDDVPLRHWLEAMLKALAADPSVGLVYPIVLVVDRELRVLGLWPDLPKNDGFPEGPDEYFKYLFTGGNFIPNSGLLLRRQVWEAHGGYPFEGAQGDHMWMMCLAARGIRMEVVLEPLVKFQRDAQHQHMWARANTEMICERYANILRRTQNWLKENGIHRYRHLYAPAKLALLVRRFQDRTFFRRMLVYFVNLPQHFLNPAYYSAIRKDLAGAIRRQGQRMRKRKRNAACY